MKIEIDKKIEATMEGLSEALKLTNQDYGFEAYSKTWVESKLKRVLAAIKNSNLSEKKLYVSGMDVYYFSPDGKGSHILHKFRWEGCLTNHSARKILRIGEWHFNLSDGLYDRDRLRGLYKWTVSF